MNDLNVRMLAGSVELDPEGLAMDIFSLTTENWRVKENDEQHLIFDKHGDQLNLRASQSEDNRHRVFWELSIQTGQTRIGYASTVLRPGDITTGVVDDLLKEAINGAEVEIEKWNQAVAEARRSLLKTNE